MDKLGSEDLADLFQIALFNFVPPGRIRFDWAGFRPEMVTSIHDLPSYLIFGPLDSKSFVCTPEGWTAAWQGDNSEGKISVSWKKDARRYFLSQTWQGISGDHQSVDDSCSFAEAIASLYKEGVPVVWDEYAKETSEEYFQLTWVKADERFPTLLSFPDGVFRVISFPVMVKNIQNVKSILAHMAKDNVPYAFFATCTLMQQDIYYESGRAPEWTQDIAACLTQSIGETGLIPTNIPQKEVIGHKTYHHLERDVMMVNISVPFVCVLNFLNRLEATPMPIVSAKQAPLRRELLPVIWPQKISEKLTSLELDDNQQGIKVIYRFIAQEIDLDELLKQDSINQIKRLEGFADDMLKEITEHIDSKSTS